MPLVRRPEEDSCPNAPGQSTGAGGGESGREEGGRWIRVPQTVGNRTGLTGPDRFRFVRYEIGPNSKFKFKFKKIKKIKKFLKILKGATNLMVSNFLKNSFI